MKHIINKCILLVMLSLCSFMVFAQKTIQGSLAPGTNDGEVDLYLSSNYESSFTEYFTNIVVTFTIPTTSATAQTTLTCISSNIASITAADFNAGIVANNTVGSETTFTCTGNNSNTTRCYFPNVYSFKAATFRFNDKTMNKTPIKLADFTSHTGGTNQWGYFYITTNQSDVVSDTRSYNMFFAYGAASTIGWNGLDGFVQTGATVLLPVNLIDFTASKGSQTCTVDLSWQVASESNLKNYEVQRSATGNGLNYSTISTVSALNVSNYTSQDASPLNGLNYYRLKMVDNDGKFNYSRIALISNNCTNGIAVEAWPNPATDLVNITGLTGKNNLVMLDANGRQVATYTTTGVNQKIKLGGFARGNYTIMVTSANGTVTTLKLVKL